MSDMTDELREALATPVWPAERNAEWHRAQDVIREAATAHLGCSTITDEQVEALRVLNSAIWLAFPDWAISVPETAKASQVIAEWEAADRVRRGDTR